ncbi:MAG: AAA family ATPase, partial [Planctomycetaceae bacterium]|nr:AAA family ATPase [Planctomycetaceae bacterium]
RTLNFDKGLQVIYGPNEAGKSTLLRLVRETLFGFPWAGHDLSWKVGQIAGQATVELRDGQQIEFRRQKGRPDSITGFWSDRKQPFTTECLDAILRGASEHVFTNLFAISLRELIDGEESLKRAGLGDSLFGEGWGGLADYQHVKTELAQQRDRLFKPRGRTQILHRLMYDLSNAQRDYREALIPQHELETAQSELRRFESLVQSQRTELQQLQAKHRRSESLLKALPLLRRKAVLEQEVNAKTLSQGLAGDAIDRMRVLRDRLIELDESIHRTKQEVANTNISESAELTPRQLQLLEQQQSIRSLERELSQQKKIELDLPQRESDLAAIQLRLNQRLESLGTGWTIEDVAARQVGLALRESLQELSQTVQELREQAAALKSRRPDLERDLREVQDRLKSLPETRSLVELASLIERGETWRRKQQQLEDQQLALQFVSDKLDRSTLDVEQRLATAGAAMGREPDQKRDWGNLPVPFAATVKEFAGRFTTAEQSTSNAKRLVDQSEQELRAAKYDLAEFDKLHPALDREHLVELRKRRNAGWDLVRRMYIERNGKESEVNEWLVTGETDLLEAFEALLYEIDQVADVHVAQADFLAKRDHLVARIERLESQVVDESDQVIQHQQQLELCQQEWQELWNVSTIAPGRPNAMLEWLELLQEVRELQGERLRTNAGVQSLQAEVTSFNEELARTFPHQSDPALALREAKTEFDAGQMREQERERLLREEQSLNSKLEQIQSQELELAQSQGQVDSQRSLLLRDAGLPTDWSLTTADKVLRELAECRSDLQHLQLLTKELDAARKSVAEFRERVTHITNLIVDESSPTGAEIETASATVLEALAAELHAAHDAKELLQQQKANANDASRRLIDFQESRESIQQELHELIQSSALPDDVDLTALFSEFQQRRTHEQEISNLTIELRQIVPDLAVAEEELQSESEESLAQQCEETSRQIDELERQIHEGVERLGGLRRQIESWTTENPADRIAGHLESVRTEFASAAENWAALTLAEELLHRVMSRFEKNHQPRLKESVSNWLSKLTNGRYRRIVQTMDEPNVLRVQDAQGNEKLPSQLSTGTREQLFLAIRLAYIEDYSSRHEPLPIVLDDVLVNFDEDRARETLKFLQDLSADCQVLLLTCHRRTIELCEGLPAFGNVLELVPGSWGGVEPANEERKQPAKRSRRANAPKTETQPALFPVADKKSKSASDDPET